MADFRVRYKNSQFKKEKLEVDGKSFTACEFEDCILIVENGDTDLSGCRFKNCKLMLRGNAFKIGKLIELFSKKGPVKVLDVDEPLFERRGEG